MELALESVLQQRSHQLAERLLRKRSVVLSLVLHLVLFTSLVVGPLLSIQEAEPIEFTPITIVPVQALGVEIPVAPPARAEAPPKPETKPALPEPDVKPARETVPDPQPAAASETAPDSAGTGQQAALGQRRGSAMGSSLGTSALGASVGGLDNPDFVYGYYVDQMLAMIGAHWQRPALGADVEAIVHFRIFSDGHISDLRIAKSSGYNSYDLAGLRAVQLATPFPKLPQSYRHRSLGVNLILR